MNSIEAGPESLPSTFDDKTLICFLNDLLRNPGAVHQLIERISPCANFTRLEFTSDLAALHGTLTAKNEKGTYRLNDDEKLQYLRKWLLTHRL